ncbi:phage holin family protein [Rossellomorea vietnamensis]|uniref:Phage holin family protein n=2 Tax=Rossellomorea vietnamensis TaxID=218284 RepID=A0A5D4K689_9BACI|nr:phage holin family protein [Rossellomorea vietnamensis]TYS19946.1 phage holin family protein [Rossellomorea vietnamensis]
MIIPFASIITSTVSNMTSSGWSQLLMVLIIAMILDYITGLIAAGINGELSSSTGMKGIGKKVLVFSLVAAAHLIDTILGNQHIIRDSTIIFYICNEILSIIENAGRAGLPIPPLLRGAVKSLRNKITRKNKSE